MTDLERLPLVWSYLNAEDSTAGRRRPNGNWQVRRFCQEDWLLNVRVQRVVGRHRFEIALFLAEDHQKFVRDAGVMGGLVFALSEAYDKTGTMQIDFVGPPEGHEPEIPLSIRRVAAALNVSIGGTNQIADSEGRELYARLTGLSDEVIAILRTRAIDLVKACFVVHRGLWTKGQLELIAKSAHAPERVLGGQVFAEQRIQYLHDLLLLRVALLMERLETMLSTLCGMKDVMVSSQWVKNCCLQTSVSRSVELPTFVSDTLTVSSNCPLTAALVPRDTTGYVVWGERDIEAAASVPEPRCLVVTQDVSWLPAELRCHLVDCARRRQVAIIPIVDTLGELDAEIEERLARVFSTKRGVPERPD